MNAYSGEQLRKIREKKKWSQAKLAVELSNYFSRAGNDRVIQQRSIASWESESGCDPSANNLAALAHVLGCRMENFFTLKVQSSDESTNNRRTKAA